MNTRHLALEHRGLANARDWPSLESLLAKDRVDEAPMTGIGTFGFEAGLIARVTDCWPSCYEPEPRAPVRVLRY